MSELLFGHDETVAEWIAQQPFGDRFTQPYTAIGVVSDGRLIGGFAFTFKTKYSVSLSLAGKGVASRGAWRGVLDYVFRQMGCTRLECRTSVKNKIVKKSLPRLGLRFEGKARRLFGEHDGLCFSLTVDDLADFRKKWRL